MYRERQPVSGDGGSAERKERPSQGDTNDVRDRQVNSLITINSETPTLASQDVMDHVDAAGKWLERIISTSNRNRELLDEALPRIVQVNQPKLERLEAPGSGAELLSFIKTMKTTDTNDGLLSMVKTTMSTALRRTSLQ